MHTEHISYLYRFVVPLLSFQRYRLLLSTATANLCIPNLSVWILRSIVFSLLACTGNLVGAATQQSNITDEPRGFNTQTLEQSKIYGPKVSVKYVAKEQSTIYTNSSSTPDGDRAILVELYQALDGSNWVNKTNWLTDEPISKWYGVTTNANGRVISLDLSGNYRAQHGLKGSLPSSIGDLSQLIRLNLTYNEISGPIPPTIRQLVNLTHLELLFNEISGGLPAEIGQLSSLEVLDLGGNNLTGEIPAAIWQLSNLTYLQLGGNQLTGSIPPTIGDLTKLSRLYIYRNQFTGLLPEELTTLPLSTFWWHDNALCMPDTDAFSAWVNQIVRYRGSGLCNYTDGRDALVALFDSTGGEDWVNNANWMSDQPLNAWYGVRIDGSGTVVGLHLRSNGLRGSIPNEIGELSSLETLDLSRNELTGEVPAEIGRLNNLTYLRLGGNQLTGSIPPTIGDLTKLNHLSINSNQFSGLLPEELTTLPLSTFWWYDNALCMPATDAFATWVSQIASHEGSGLCNYTDGRDALVALFDSTGGEDWVNNANWMSDQPLNAWYGVRIDGSGTVVGLHLRSNGLRGSIPNEIGELSSLETLDLSRNELTGEVPAEIGRLNNLTYLRLGGNQLTGSIPPTIGDLTKLNHLSINSNQFSGLLPEELTTLPLSTFWWYDNALCMPATDAFATWVSQIASHEGSGLCNYTDGRDALVALFDSTGGEDWVNNANWMSDQPLNAWYGVRIDGSGTVVGLHLRSNGLRGSIPNEIGELSSLETLDLSRNELTGEVPAEIGRLNNLTYLRLGGNQLTGSIPPTIGDLTKLNHLSINSNQFSGLLPEELTTLPLSTFWWYDNALCMPATDAFATWVSQIASHEGSGLCNYTDGRDALVALFDSTGGEDWVNNANWMSDQPLNAWYGVRIDGSGTVVGLHLRSNGLRGSIPNEIGELSSLETLDLSRNELTGEVPAEIGRLNNLTYLRLGGNQLTGSIPPTIGDLTKLNHLSINSNQFSGLLPEELTTLPLSTFWWYDNALCMPATDAFATWVSQIASHEGSGLCNYTDGRDALVALFDSTGGEDWVNNANWMSDQPLNAWYGVRIDGSGTVVGLHLRSNGLRGSIPNEIGELSSLETLDLSRNELTGEVPAEIGRLNNLTYLRLGGNQLTGSIPPTIGDLTKLNHLSINSNQFSGLLPEELTTLPLSTFWWYDNALCMPATDAFATWVSQIASHEGSGLCNYTDGRDALVALFDSTGGEDWVNNANWMSDQPLNAWYGVQVDGSGAIVSLKLRRNLLRGSIPSEIEQLTSLVNLDLARNELSGEIPAAIGQLTSLQTLALNSNRLTGPLPSRIVHARKVQRLQIRGNRVCIPATLEFERWLQSITDSDVKSDHFCNRDDRSTLLQLYAKTQGSAWERAEGWEEESTFLYKWYGIETDAALGRVVSIDLDDNGLKGALPLSLGSLTELSVLRLQRNELEGRLPLGMRNLTVHELQLADSGLCMPADATFQAWLSNVVTRSGTDTVCEPHADIDALQHVFKEIGGGWLEKNNWLPDVDPSEWEGIEINEFGRVMTIDVQGKGLKGQMPIEFNNLTELRSLDLSGNALHGTIPPGFFLERLEVLDLSGNDLSGEIPAGLGRLARLEIMWLHNNQLSGSIPVELGNLANLRSLALSHNDLTGPIPVELGGLVRLSELDLSSNRLSGEIPPILGNLTNLSHLHLQDNLLGGSIPGELGNLSRLHTLRLDNNMLRGPIPAEFDGLASLEKLFAGSNQLDGELPPNLGQLNDLSELYLDRNNLRGTVPEELSRLSNLQILVLSFNSGLDGTLPSALTNLKLVRLLASGTNVCAPPDRTFDDWLATIPKRRLLRCNQEELLAFMSQAVQSHTHPVPLVAGKGALLRVFPTVEKGTDASMPPMRAKFYLQDSEVHVADIAGKVRSIPEEVDIGNLSASANAQIPGEVIQPGLEFVVDVDHESTLDGSVELIRRIPSVGRMKVNVLRMPPFRVTVIPFIWVENDDDGIVDVVRDMAEQPEEHRLFEDTRALLPIDELHVRAHDPVISSSNDGRDVYRQTVAIAAMEGSTDYYLGMMSAVTGSVSGLAALPGRTSFSLPISSIIAHEFGHNLWLPHAPCGNPPRVDESFPYPDGTIGVWGYDASASGKMVSPSTPDFMSYCGPEWTSDYSFTNAARFRQLFEAEPSSEPVAHRQSLLLWGGLTEQGQLALNPTFVVHASPQLPTALGSYALHLNSRDGTKLLTLRFDMHDIANTAGARGFAFIVPVEPWWQISLASITLMGPHGRIEQRTNTADPMTVLQNPVSGQVTAFLSHQRGSSLNRVAEIIENSKARGMKVMHSAGMPEADAWGP